MTGVGDRESGAGTRGAASPVFFFGAVALCVVPIFAHGCHRGDHDDEPAAAPVENRAELPRPSQ